MAWTLKTRELVVRGQHAAKSALIATDVFTDLGCDTVLLEP
jgi:hypothetical protein